MKESKPVSELEAINSVKNLAKGVFCISALQFLAGVAFLTIFDDSMGSQFRIGGILMAVGAVLFAFGLMLFKKQSYPVAVVLAILTGILCGLNLFSTVVSVFSGEGIAASGTLVSVLFFYASYKGMQSAKVLEKIRSEKISPDIFS